jgi:hypothetical protein
MATLPNAQRPRSDSPWDTRTRYPLVLPEYLFFYGVFFDGHYLATTFSLLGPFPVGLARGGRQQSGRGGGP